MSGKTFVAQNGNHLPIPNYSERCITRIPEFVRTTLLQKSKGPLADLIRQTGVDTSNVNHIVLFLIDGFGYAQWQKLKNELPALQAFEAKGSVLTIDTVFPSSTAIALNSINANGILPAEHGLLGWYQYITELDDTIVTLPFMSVYDKSPGDLVKKNTSPTILLDAKTTYEALQEQDINSAIFTKRIYSATPYSTVAYRGARIVPYDGSSDLFANLAEHLKDAAKPAYTHVYWGDIDSAGHQSGLYSQEYQEQLHTFFDSFDAFIKGVDSSEQNNTLFIITADHGQLDCTDVPIIDCAAIVGLTELLAVSPQGKIIFPWGEQRELFLAIKPGRVNDVINLLDAAIGNECDIIQTKKALEQGLFGPVTVQHPQLPSRMGDLLILPRGKHTIRYTYPGVQPPTLKAQHGGLHKDELKIPFALYRPSNPRAG